MNTNPVNYNNGLVLYDNKPIYSAVSGGDWEYAPVNYNLVYHVDPNASGNYTQSAWTAAVIHYQTTAACPSAIYNCFADDYSLVGSGALVKNPRIAGVFTSTPSRVANVPLPVTTADNLKANYILNNISEPIANVMVLPYLQNNVPKSLPKSARCTYAIDYGEIDCSVVDSAGPYSIDGIRVYPGCTAIRNVHLTGEQIMLNYNNQGDPPPRYSATHDYCNQIWENITWQTNNASVSTYIPLQRSSILLAGRHGNYSNSSVCQIKDEQLGYVIKNVNFTFSNHGDYQYIHDMRMSLNGVSSYCPVYVENYTGGLRVDVGSGDDYANKPLSGYTFKGNNDFVLCNTSTDRFIGPPPSGFIDCKFIDTPVIRLQSLKEYWNYSSWSGNGFNNLSATNWTIKSTDTANNKLILKNSRSHPFNLSGKAFILDNVHLEQGTEFYITNCSGTVHTLNGATYVGVYKV